MRVHTVNRLAADLQARAQLGNRRLQFVLAFGGVKKRAAELAQVIRQRVKRPRIVVGAVHSQPQLGCKASGPDLRCAVSQRVHHLVVPGGGVGGHIDREQSHQFSNLRLGNAGQPQRIKPGRRHQREQLGCVNGFRRAGQ